MEKINIGIVAHVDAGKTTITEHLLYHGGVLRTIGSVDLGTSQTDFMEVERTRGISVQSSCVSIITPEKQVNIIDTPGHIDFVAEVERALSILDAAILVISAVEGIQSQTEVLFEALKATHTNVIIFINKIDRIGSNVAKVLEQVKEKFSNHVILCSKVENEGEKTCNAEFISDYSFNHQISSGLSDELEALTLLVSEFDEEIMNQYLSGDMIDHSKVLAKFKSNVHNGNIIPVLCGSGSLDVGIVELYQFILEFISPTKNRNDDKLSGIIYKVTHDKSMGRIAHVRLFGGTIHNRDIIYLPSSSDGAKITQIRRYAGSKYYDVGEASTGDIVALCGLSNAKISDIFGEVHDILNYKMAVPLLKVSVIPESKDELHKVMLAFDELSAEDPQLDMEYRKEDGELLISITGTIQLEILRVVVKERYNLDVSFSKPSVIYKETPSRKGHGCDYYTMPKPCWAIIHFDIEPLPRGSGLVYSSIVPNDKMFYRYQNHVAMTVPKALKQGMYNWEVTDLKVTLVDGEHHIMHTHPMDFFLATPLAIMDGLRNTGTTLLEPMQTLHIIASEEYVGKIIGDLIAMRGQFDSPIISSGQCQIKAVVPVSTSLDYSIRLASLTSGKGLLSTRFYGYQECLVELGSIAKRYGVNPLDRDKWILSQRNALN
jgi:ribosomal protection tetracycline resistance protein